MSDNTKMTPEEFLEHYLKMCETYFRDNDCSEYTKDAREFIMDTNIMLGTGVDADGNPNMMWESRITREQCAVIIYRTCNYMTTVFRDMLDEQSKE